MVLIALHKDLMRTQILTEKRSGEGAVHAYHLQ